MCVRCAAFAATQRRGAAHAQAEGCSRQWQRCGRGRASMACVVGRRRRRKLACGGCMCAACACAVAARGGRHWSLSPRRVRRREAQCRAGAGHPSTLRLHLEPHARSRPSQLQPAAVEATRLDHTGSQTGCRGAFTTRRGARAFAIGLSLVRCPWAFGAGEVGQAHPSARQAGAHRRACAVRCRKASIAPTGCASLCRAPQACCGHPGAHPWCLTATGSAAGSGLPGPRPLARRSLAELARPARALAAPAGQRQARRRLLAAPGLATAARRAAPARVRPALPKDATSRGRRSRQRAGSWRA